MPKCKVCKTKFEPKFNTTQAVCSPKCALEKGKKDAEKKRKATQAKERKDLRKRKEALKSRGDWLREAQIEFNKFIRLRDAKEPCISCQRSTGCKMNAGHYRSVGSSPELRFNEFNVHIQCEHCNNFKSGSPIDYRINLVKKIGLERVEWLEGKHEPKKYTIEEIKEIKSKYKKLANELNKCLD
jgi:hypothetical protein